MPELPAEIAALIGAIDEVDRDAAKLVDGLDETAGTWQPAPGVWSVAHCLDHLAVGNRVYLAAMAEPAARARAAGRLRRRPARPGFIGGMFVNYLEPPVRIKTRNPKKSTPRSSPPLADAYAAFRRSNDDLRAFIRANADLDLASIRFPNPFVRGVRFSLATGIHVLPAHERRHVWQAWRVREARARPLQ